MWGARTTRAEVELQERDLAILQGLFESRLMTLNHITHLFFDGHGEAAKKRIQRLKEERYVRILVTYLILNPIGLFFGSFGPRLLGRSEELANRLENELKLWSIVLVSLATEGGTVSQENASTFATLMLADLWTAAKERGKGTDPKPFYLYLDEFQRFVSPTIAENLDEARGFGLHLTLAHQYPSQLIEASREYGQRLYESVMENARSKVVFSLSLRDRNLAPLADWLYSGTFDPSRVKHELYSTKVMGYAEETREISSRGTSRGTGRSEARGEAVGMGSMQGEYWGASGDGAVILTPTQWSQSTGESRASTDTSTRGQSESESESESVSEVPVFIPIFGEERSSVQYSPLEEQRFQAEQRIMMQKERHATARFLDMNTPVELRTPDVSPLFVREGRVEKYRLEQLAKLPYVLSCEEAQARLEKRHTTRAEVEIRCERQW
jgi:TraM recognition site of TraD and TraG